MKKVIFRTLSILVLAFGALLLFAGLCGMYGWFGTDTSHGGAENVFINFPLCVAIGLMFWGISNMSDL